jgi:hypothetical protein
VEIFQGTLGLGAPEPVRGNCYWSECIPFCSGEFHSIPYLGVPLGQISNLSWIFMFLCCSFVLLDLELSRFLFVQKQKTKRVTLDKSHSGCGRPKGGKHPFNPQSRTGLCPPFYFYCTRERIGSLCEFFSGSITTSICNLLFTAAPSIFPG